MKKILHRIIYMPCFVLKETLTAIGLLLGLYTGFAFFFHCMEEETVRKIFFFIIIFISIIYGRYKTWKSEKIQFALPNTNTTIEIVFGDLFTQDGLRVIPVNEFFDSKIGRPVSDKSLHGILIKNHLSGKTFDDEVDPHLNKITSAKNVSKKIDGKTKKYPIGTTVKITTDGDYLLFALSETKPDTCKAYCDVATMWKALEGLWEKARDESNGSPINVPLVGGGQSGMGLPPRNLLDIIILSAIRTTQQQRIAPKIRIILHENHFEELDLRSIKQYWKE
jgi:hypothetical protein